MRDYFDLQLYVEVDVGEPPQTMKVVADTGSKWVWVQTDECSRCGGLNHYHEELSETLVEVNSFYRTTVSYGSGDVHGYHSRE